MYLQNKSKLILKGFCIKKKRLTCYEFCNMHFKYKQTAFNSSVSWEREQGIDVLILTLESTQIFVVVLAFDIQKQKLKLIVFIQYNKTQQIKVIQFYFRVNYKFYININKVEDIFIQ